MKPLVLYRSKTGYTEKYARQLARELGCEAREFRKDEGSWREYDRVIYGGGLYAGGINGLKSFRKRMQAEAGKRYFLFAVGATPGRPDEIDAIRSHNLTAQEAKTLPFFYLRGGFDYEKLSGADRLMMALMRKALAAQKTPGPDDQALLAAFGDPVDFTDYEGLNPIIRAVREGKNMQQDTVQYP
ncbi:MAG: flavodoxin domain-containing protein [Christensenellaceae bacterium]